MQSSVDSVPNRPGEQGVHVEAPAACRVSVIDPGGQSTQSTVEFRLNLPAVHAWHDDAPTASNVLVTAPGSHVMQSETWALPRLVSTLSLAALTTYKQLPRSGSGAGSGNDEPAVLTYRQLPLELLAPLVDRHVSHVPVPSQLPSEMDRQAASATQAARAAAAVL